MAYCLDAVVVCQIFKVLYYHKIDSLQVFCYVEWSVSMTPTNAIAVPCESDLNSLENLVENTEHACESNAR